MLKSARFQLIEIEQKHKKFIHKGLSDERITEFYGVHFPDLEAVQEQMDWYANLRKNKTGIWWLITTESGEICGAVGYNELDSVHRKAEIGLWLLTEFWGQGIMSEVMPIVLEFGFNELDLNRVEGIVQSQNLKCIKAIKKVGFVHEGTLRDFEIKNDQFIDVDVFAMLKSDWQKRNI